MPLLIIAGPPSSGKTTIVERLVADFESRGFGKIKVISDEGDTNFSKQIYNDFKTEKQHRSSLRSAVERHLNKEVLVICDSLNYVKGFRYELFCVAKQNETTYAVLSTNANLPLCHWLNCQNQTNKYSDDLLDSLFNRQEKPNAKNRWDYPLFEINIGESLMEGDESVCCDVDGVPLDAEALRCSSSTVNFAAPAQTQLPRLISLPLDDIYSHLIEGKELKANVSTQSFTPKSSSTFLHELDRVTQKVVNTLINMQRNAVPGDLIDVLDSGLEVNKIKFSRMRSLPELTRLRKQFINYMKTHPVEDFDVISSLFVNFLNSNP